jgi:amidase
VNADARAGAPDAVRVPPDPIGAFVGAPSVLASGAASGPLVGTTLAVKDVFDVAGTVTGAGNPDFAARHGAAAAHAAAVAALVAAGAAVVGRSVTDELAYSLSGTNVHHGTPRNVVAPGRVPGGSSAGSAAAVAAGLVDLGLGTDTGGSIRVPASYCGIIGWRPTHGRVDTTGVVPLARSFDTVGLLARDLDLLADAARVLAGPDDLSVGLPAGPPVGLGELMAAVAPPVRAAVVAATGDPPLAWLGVDPPSAAEAFRALQGREAWTTHGAWISAARPRFGPGVAARFEAASRVTDDEVADAEVVRAAVRAAVVQATAGGRVLVAAAAPGPAPALDEPPDAKATGRASTLQLTALAGLAGAPVVVVPRASVDGLPLGVAVIGAPGADLGLLAWVGEHLGGAVRQTSTGSRS